MTVGENLELGAYVLKDKRNLRRQLEMVYKLFPILEERRDQKAGSLSGGEMQMLEMGRALTAAVDPAGRTLPRAVTADGQRRIQQDHGGQQGGNGYPDGGAECG